MRPLSSTLRFEPYQPTAAGGSIVDRSAEVSMLSRPPHDGPCPVAIGAVDTTMPVCACTGSSLLVYKQEARENKSKPSCTEFRLYVSVHGAKSLAAS